MVMDTIQVRLGSGLVKKIDELVDTGIYSSRSDVLRDAVRRLVLGKIIGIISEKEDSVNQIKKMRKSASKEKFDIEAINQLAD
ncbi:MAG TPA: ribbon-helix-helix protein, CopG family [Candidatus Nanoarchaeia archaeon]|nr:ribbon-helix-helix protein, CopG family [Candidatus Nanoarchaeia archaeon]